jgi:hypothetical protein
MKDLIDETSLPPLVVKARRALREAAQAAAEEHWRAGRPVYIWRDGQVMALFEDGTCVPASTIDKNRQEKQ